jgi:hypothetical protein
VKKLNPLLRLEKLKGREVRVIDLPAYFPNLDRTRVVEAGVRSVFDGSLVPGKTPGRYTNKKA